ncbi:MAG TPA: MFS transporter [Kofleriaceae bacterium]|nr:MFS transporter [Kofleriaceae bacterium]
MAAATLLGFASGLPLYLTGMVLVTWMGQAGMSIKTASAFASVGLPYTFKWAWAPLFDRLAWPFFGRRRGWIVVLELALVVAILALAGTGVAADVETIAVLAVTVAALSASHDVVVDAFLAESLAPAERPAGAAGYVFGYRAAMLAVGGAGFYLAHYTSWPVLYATVAALVPVGIAGALLLPEPAPPTEPPSFYSTIVGSLVELLTRRGLVAILLAIATFRFGEHLVMHVQGYFLVQVARVDVRAMGWVLPIAGFSGLAAGGVVLTTIGARLGPRTSLYVFGAFAAAANLGWALLAWVGAPLPLFAAAAFLDNFGTALASSSFVAFVMGQTSPGHTATQYALLNALSSVGGRVFGFIIAPMVACLGWGGFFAATAAMILPALVAFALVPRERFPGVASSAEPS